MNFILRHFQGVFEVQAENLNTAGFFVELSPSHLFAVATRQRMPCNSDWWHCRSWVGGRLPDPEGDGDIVFLVS